MDVVLDMVGGDVFRRSFEVLTPFARLVVYGPAGAAGATLDTIELLRPTHTVGGFYLGGQFGRGTMVHDSLATVFGDVASGKLKVADVTRFLLTAEAHRDIHERRTTGKVVLEPWA